MFAQRFFTVTASSIVATFLLAGCDKLGAYNHWQASDTKPDIANVSYGADDRQVLDLYLPDVQAQPAPVVIWFYGGSWDAGNKAQYAFVAKRFTEMGYAVAIPDYRLVPDVHFPQFIEDCARAVAFMKNFGEQNPNKIAAGPMIVAGHSAGAYNAVQLVADPDYLRAVEMHASNIAGIIGLSGPYDFYPYDVKATQNAFGDTPAVKSQPVEMDLTHMPPLLLITGTRDHTVYPRNSRNLAKLTPDTKLVEIPEAGHAGTLIALGFYLTTNDDVLEPVTSFLRVHLPTVSDKPLVAQDKAS